MGKLVDQKLSTQQFTWHKTEFNHYTVILYLLYFVTVVDNKMGIYSGYIQ